jgi:DNA polymerase-3 subunit beta
MECIVEREEILRCLYLVQGVVEKRTPLPILAHVLIESSGEDLSLGATDLEIGIRQKCKADVKKGGAFTADARKLYEIVREFPQGPVVLRLADSGWVEVKGEKSRFRIASLDPREFPTMSTRSSSNEEKNATEGEETLPTSVFLPREVMKEMVEKTLFAISSDETRPSLSGVLLEVDNSSDGGPGKLRMVASDGHRLSLIEKLVPSEGDRPLDPNSWPLVILPRKGLVETRKLIERGDGEVEITVQGVIAGLKQGSTELSMRLIEGEFPDYRQVIPTQSKHLLSFQRNDFFNAIRRLLILTTERSRGVKLDVEKGKMELSVNNPDLGEGVEEVETDYTGGELTIGFNGRYLVDMLSVLEEGSRLQMTLNDEVSPGVIRVEGNEDYLYVLMPMRIF